MRPIEIIAFSNFGVSPSTTDIGQKKVYYIPSLWVNKPFKFSFLKSDLFSHILPHFPFKMTILWSRFFVVFDRRTKIFFGSFFPDISEIVNKNRGNNFNSFIVEFIFVKSVVILVK